MEGYVIEHEYLGKHAGEKHYLIRGGYVSDSPIYIDCYKKESVAKAIATKYNKSSAYYAKLNMEEEGIYRVKKITF